MSQPVPQKTHLSLAISGGKQLSGSVTTSTSKNGAVGLLAASLLNRGVTTLHKMPQIEEVFRLIEVLRSIGVSVEWEGTTVVITPPEHIDLGKIDQTAARLTRSIIMFIGPLLHHFKEFSVPQAGGCKLGSRTVRPHFYALEPLGVSIDTDEMHFNVSHATLNVGEEIVLYESGDTVTENLIMAAALVPGKTVIKYASANYQVAELCYFLMKCGVTFEGLGTTTLTVHGVERIEANISYTLSEDPIDAMFFLAAAIVTNSEIKILRAPIDYLEVELIKLEKMGFQYEKTPRYKSTNGFTDLVDITTKPSNLVALEEKIYGRPYPGLNIDNLPFFAVIATQAEGETLIHDWAYDGRAIHYMELERLGADMLLADPHRVFVKGKTTLKPADLVCPPALRPAAILLIGMLGAKGDSRLRNIYSIKRGYENIAERLSELGAGVEMFTETALFQ
jgi:UDP-N-acetylglucosamine 1-carboxyvinyltransferase